MYWIQLSGALMLAPAIAALPEHLQRADIARELHPLITPAPELPTRTLPRSHGAGVADAHEAQRRDIFSDLKTLGDGLFSDLSSLGSAAVSYVTSQYAVETNYLAGVPTDGSAALSSLGIGDSALAASPTMVLNLPNYGNWTDQGWNLRFRANVYKTPNLTTSQLDDLANKFLIGTSIQALTPPQQTHARNVTAEIFVVQQGDQNVTFNLEPAPQSNGQTPSGNNQTIHYPTPTTPEGDLDGFVLINGAGYMNGNETTDPQRIDVYTQGTDTGNATSFLVPPEGYTVISDIDDILRVTKIWAPAQGIFNTFAANFTPWMNMPDIYANWSSSVAGIHFHYLTTTPEQATRNYMDFIYKTYPLGTFDTRPLNFSDISATLSIRKFLLERIFRTFPKRKFVLVADTSNSDVMRDYPEMATEFPGQVACILLRNTSATDPTDKFPYDTTHFQGVDNNTYMFFHVPDDLTNIDITSGHCVNKTFAQNVSFSMQGLPFGLSSNDAGRTVARGIGAVGWTLLAAAVMWLL